LVIWSSIAPVVDVFPGQFDRDDFTALGLDADM
jgi:hypothetical protein